MPFTPATGPALREAKRDLRTRVLAARDALPPEERAAASRAIAQALVARPEFAAARAVLLTLPFRSEWDTRAVARAALAAGKTVAVPRVDADARVLALHAVDALDTQVMPGYRGVPEPRIDLPRVAPDGIALVIVPGVAFDAHGRRLGYGGGYYDRLLPLLPAHAPRIAGAFDVQVVGEVPAAAHDATVDVLITPTRALALPPRMR